MIGYQCSETLSTRTVMGTSLTLGLEMETSWTGTKTLLVTDQLGGVESTLLHGDAGLAGEVCR